MGRSEETAEVGGVESTKPEAAEAAEPTESAPAERTGWSRWVVIGGTLLAVLLVGAAIGVFATRLTDGSDAVPATPGAGSVEVGFAQDMSVHHLQAVTMAGWARDHSADQEIRQLAFDIERTQTEQVGRMKGWLMLWDQPEQATGAYMKWMTEPMGHAGMQMPTSSPAGGAPMPGMATDAELAKLRTLSGRALDVDFLQLMLRHHQGGVAMAEYTQDHTANDAVKALCRSMLVSQGAEMDQMKAMLTARSAQPLPAP